MDEASAAPLMRDVGFLSPIGNLIQLLVNPPKSLFGDEGIAEGWTDFLLGL
jgi:hypothetical protein